MKTCCGKIGLDTKMDRQWCPRCGRDHGVAPTSEQFIAWAIGKLADPEFYQWVVAEVLHEAQEYFRAPRETIISQLTTKLHRGAEEHGVPIYDDAELVRHIAEEQIDLLGWKMVELFQSHVNS